MALDPIVRPPSSPPWEEGAERRHAGILDKFHALTAACHEIARLLSQHAPREPLGQARILNAASPWSVDRKGYHYLRIFAVGSTSVTVDVGAGPTALTLNAGWNNVDWPQGATVLGTGNIFVQLTDYYPTA